MIRIKFLLDLKLGKEIKFFNGKLYVYIKWVLDGYKIVILVLV